MGDNSKTYFSFLFVSLMLMSFEGNKGKFVYEDLFLNGKQIEVYNINELNSKGSDFCAVPFRNGIVFTSSRNSSDKDGLKNIFNNNYFDLFYSEKTGNDHYTDPKKLRGDINGDLHDGPASFNQTSSIMYFTRNNEKVKGLVSLKIYSAKEKNEKWVDLKELSFNGNKFSSCHPSLSKDGKTIYFASNRPGGYGGMDIYKTIMKDGKWGDPKNLGVNVNGEGNELFPYINEVGHLFYSSDGYGTIGKLDIFLCKKNGNGFKYRMNVGEPINSKWDDFGFFIDKNAEQGYLSSNRNGGNGNDDIYGWKLVNKKIVKKIIVIDQSTGEKINGAKIFIENQKNSWSPSILKNIEFGTYGYEIIDAEIYNLNIEKEGYFDYVAILTKDIIYNEKETIVLPNKRKYKLFLGKMMEQVSQVSMGNVEIELLNECDGSKQTTKSDEDGNYRFDIMCGCEYVVIAKKNGFMTRTKIISKSSNPCHSNQSIEKVIEMKEVSKSNRPRASIFDNK